MSQITRFYVITVIIPRVAKVTMKLLTDLYEIQSPPKGEAKISEFVQAYLTELGIEFEVDNYHQVYSLKPTTPMVCCHMDQVTGVNYATEFMVTEDGKIFGNGNLGADDKNGVWCCLKLLELFPDISFIFSCQEEAGGKIDVILNNKVHEEVLASIYYCLVFDRTNSGDIICNYNSYGVIEFENDLLAIGVDYGYSPTYGVFSDCDTINRYMSCCNLSVGYYKHHSNTEYTVYPELLNALAYGEAILRKLDKRYDKPEVFDWYGSWRSRWRENSPLRDAGHDDYNSSWEADTCEWCVYCSTYVALEDMVHQGNYKCCPHCMSWLRSNKNPERSTLADGGLFCPECFEQIDIELSPFTIGDYYCRTCHNLFEEMGETVAYIGVT